MTSDPVRLWPYETRYALLAAPILFVGVLLLFGIGHLAFGFPDKLEGGLVSVLLLASLAPVALLLVDALVGRGATIEYLGIKLALGSGANIPASVAVPTNIGVPAQPVSDSSTGQILDALRAAVSKEVVIVDLESGRAWWETRLLVLVAGAERHGRPLGIVFLATAGGAPGCFQGWGRPADLLPALLDANPKYQLCYARAKAAAAQWALVDTTETPAPPPIQPWMSRLATQHPLMAFDPGSGLPNPFAFEQFFANELGNEVEMVTGGGWVSAVRLKELFVPVLYEERIEDDWPEDQKVAGFLGAAGRYVAITRGGIYQRLLEKDAGMAALVQSLSKAAPAG
jgi:hypothetical protein